MGIIHIENTAINIQKFSMDGSGNTICSNGGNVYYHKFDGGGFSGSGHIAVCRNSREDTLHKYEFARHFLQYQPLYGIIYLSKISLQFS